MLKIKDNVELKELEKYGFVEKHCEIPNYETYYEISDRCYYFCNQYLLISAKTRIIEMGIDDEAYCVDVGTKYLPIIYDLIQAGLVEKVEK